ncbi:lysophospholipid acyltransferase family protein [Salinispira pacifica]|uniref:1-acyl-sn-glycerol-3-phosphate acyltransferase n=1 Tax=Salinispira pacifica TaxID=1307761 RepID=V5WIC4_9SPIO|nr:lysophospholipid acyltransferase family protein [Salinispira pacifica]AHC15523.1 1-acyl-sn-glycerol-3-phosphate acyltransferase [Salinispira pacifica]
MNMLRTVFFFTWMWLLLFFTILLFIPLILLSLPGLTGLKKTFVHMVTRSWARHLIATSGSNVEVRGLENVPRDRAVCVVSNHQSNFDIPLLMAYLPFPPGFIAKKELARVPFFSSWIRTLNSVFIDRKNIRASVTALSRAAGNVKEGHGMVLFPEGTRSRTGVPGRFHAAGPRTMAQQGITFLPVTIYNSREMFEKQMRIIPTKIRMEIHPPVEGSRENDHTITSLLKDIILTPLGTVESEQERTE